MNKQNKSQQLPNEIILKRAALVPIIVSLLLIMLKIYGWIATGSLSIFSSLVDSFLDILISGINLIAIYYALKPADEDHRFGHSAVEDIVGLAQAAFIIGAALMIFLEGVNHVVNPSIVNNVNVGIVTMLIVIVITFALVMFQKVVSKKTGSVVIVADSVHYETDLLMNLAIIITLYLNVKYLDVVLAIFIALYISKSALQIGRGAFDNLMAKEMPDKMKQRIYQIIAKQQDVKGFHELKTRSSGRKIFIQMHIEIDKNLSLSVAHKITEKLECELHNAFAESEIIIHQDPV